MPPLLASGTCPASLSPVATGDHGSALPGDSEPSPRPEAPADDAQATAFSQGGAEAALSELEKLSGGCASAASS
jgi:hypothetical protein